MRKSQRRWGNRKCACQPSLRDLCNLEFGPGVETPGYCQRSLRNQSRAPVQVLRFAFSRFFLKTPLASAIFNTDKSNPPPGSRS